MTEMHQVLFITRVLQAKQLRSFQSRLVRCALTQYILRYDKTYTYKTK